MLKRIYNRRSNSKPATSQRPALRFDLKRHKPEQGCSRQFGWLDVTDEAPIIMPAVQYDQPPKMPE